MHSRQNRRADCAYEDITQTARTIEEGPVGISRPGPTPEEEGDGATVEVESFNERGERLSTAIAGEHPLTIYLDKREIVTLMTLGQTPEALVIGYLRNQRQYAGNLVALGKVPGAAGVSWGEAFAMISSRLP